MSRSGWIYNSNNLSLSDRHCHTHAHNPFPYSSLVHTQPRVTEWTDPGSPDPGNGKTRPFCGHLLLKVRLAGAKRKHWWDLAQTQEPRTQTRTRTQNPESMASPHPDKGQRPAVWYNIGHKGTRDIRKLANKQAIGEDERPGRYIDKGNRCSTPQKSLSGIQSWSSSQSSSPSCCSGSFLVFFFFSFFCCVAKAIKKQHTIEMGNLGVNAVGEIGIIIFIR